MRRHILILIHPIPKPLAFGVGQKLAWRDGYLYEAENGPEGKGKGGGRTGHSYTWLYLVRVNNDGYTRSTSLPRGK